METFSSTQTRHFEFDQSHPSTSISAADAMRIVEEEGAVAIHNFVPHALVHEVARELREAAMFTDYTPDGAAIERNQDLSRYGFAHGKSWLTPIEDLQRPPKYMHDAAQHIANFVNSGIARYDDEEVRFWSPNEIIGHNYNIGQFIDPHHDSLRAVGVVAVETFFGSQPFNARLDSGGIATVQTRPRTLTLLRGYQGPNGRPRPEHWVDRAVEQRLAMSVREWVTLPKK